MPLVYCPVASAAPIYIGAGDSASQGYRPDLLQDVPDQGHHVLTSGAHVPGLASGSPLQDLINPNLLFLLKFPTRNSNEALFQPPHGPVGNKMLFNHLRYFCVLLVGMDVVIMVVIHVPVQNTILTKMQFCERDRHRDRDFAKSLSVFVICESMRDIQFVRVGICAICVSKCTIFERRASSFSSVVHPERVPIPSRSEPGPSGEPKFEEVNCRGELGTGVPDATRV